MAENGGNVTVVGNLGDLAILDVSDAGDGVEGLLGLLTGLGVGKILVVLLETGHHLGQERSNDIGVVDELAHVVDDDGRLTLDGGLTLGKTTVEKRDHESEGGLLDLGDESGGTEQVNSLRDVLGLGDTLDELGDEALDIPVDDELADLLHRLVGSVLDLLLGVPHGLGDDGDELGDAERGLSGGGADEGVKEVERSHLLGPLLGVSERVDERRESGLDGVGVDGLSDGQGSGDRGSLDRRDLVTGTGEDAGQEDDQVGLDVGRDLGVLGNLPDGDETLLTSTGILLVVQLLSDRLDSPGR